MAALKRVSRELESIEKDPPAGVSAGPKGEDLFSWTACISGPAGTPYEGGSFFLDITFPENYPFKPPKIKFTTQIYHCNVDATGAVCHEMLGDSWAPSLTITKVLEALAKLLSEPNPAHPLRADIAVQLTSDKAKHDAEARSWTQKHAS